MLKETILLTQEIFKQGLDLYDAENNRLKKSFESSRYYHAG
jgi:hypothetical protein